jgi:hypothetical protein
MARGVIRDTYWDIFGTLTPGRGTHSARTVVIERRTDADDPRKEPT